MYSDYDYGDDENEHGSPSDSISSEVSMDESFLRRLFKACDRDNDGFLDRYGSRLSNLFTPRLCCIYPQLNLLKYIALRYSCLYHIEASDICATYDL